MTSEHVVEGIDLHRDYRLGSVVISAIRGVTISVDPGAFLAFTGPSGSGKSTLLHLLGGIDVPTSGVVRFGKTDLATLGERDRSRLRLLNVGFVFQRFHLLPMLSASENVELPMSEAGVPRAERRDRAAALLERVGLADRRLHRPGELSGGQQQRVAVARAIANAPTVLFADEPTGELDRRTSESLVSLLADLNADGMSLVVATHDPGLAEVAPRRLEVVDGRVRP
jgi:putative ABC transport system ATP-binding protein